MPAACRLGDTIGAPCGDVLATGSPNVFVNGLPFVRVGPDITAGHCYAPTPLASGSLTVNVNGSPAGRSGDPIVPHTCTPIPDTHGGNVAAGSPNVNAGG
jgi:uncharacterized Zn-binding protein involved in type VI secretion